MADHAGREPVEPVDEVDRVDRRDHHDGGEERPLGSIERELAAVGLGEEHELDAGDDQEAGREHLPTELGEGVELEQVVEHADRADHRAGDQDDAGVAEHERTLAGEERQLPPDEVRRSQPAEHGQPTEVGNGLGVHVPVPDLRDRPGAQGDLPRDDREEIGDRGGHQEDKGVLAHQASSSVRVTPSGSRTAFSRSRESAP
jgi:hypothetical protein